MQRDRGPQSRTSHPDPCGQRRRSPRPHGPLRSSNATMKAKPRVSRIESALTSINGAAPARRKGGLAASVVLAKIMVVPCRRDGRGVAQRCRPAHGPRARSQPSRTCRRRLAGGTVIGGGTICRNRFAASSESGWKGQHGRKAAADRPEVRRLPAVQARCSQPGFAVHGVVADIDVVISASAPSAEWMRRNDVGAITLRNIMMREDVLERGPGELFAPIRGFAAKAVDWLEEQALASRPTARRPRQARPPLSPEWSAADASDHQHRVQPAAATLRRRAMRGAACSAQCAYWPSLAGCGVITARSVFIGASQDRMSLVGQIEVGDTVVDQVDTLVGEKYRVVSKEQGSRHRQSRRAIRRARAGAGTAGIRDRDTGFAG